MNNSSTSRPLWRAALLCACLALVAGCWTDDDPLPDASVDAGVEPGLEIAGAQRGGTAHAGTLSGLIGPRGGANGWAHVER